MVKIEYITLNEPNIRDFSQARNRLLNNSKANWIFFVDTDEVISEKLKTEINESIQNSKFDAFKIKRKTFFLGKPIGIDYPIRLIKKGSGTWKRAVHEEFHFHPRGGSLRSGQLDNFLIHNTAADLRSYINKINRYSTMHAKENIKEGKKTNLLKIIVYPGLKFIQTFLDSKNFVFSLMQSFHSFLGWSKMLDYKND